jgi:hypothetical protein
VTGGPDAAAPGDAPDRVGGWEPAAGETVAPQRPARPAAIEFAAATLIVSGIVRLVAVIIALVAPIDATLVVDPIIVVIEVAIQALTIATGLVVRAGKSWVVAVNAVVILTFVQLISIVGVVSLAFGFLFAIASVVVYLHRPWFDAMSAWRADLLTAARRA